MQQTFNPNTPDDQGPEHGCTVPLPGSEKTTRVVVKFNPGTGARHTGKEFTSVAAADMGGVNKLMENYPDFKMTRLFAETEAELELEVSALASATGEDIPDLPHFYQMEAEDTEQAEKLAKDLNEEAVVEHAYVEPPTYVALFDAVEDAPPTDAPPATPNFMAQQLYLNPATAGIDAKFAWTRAGGRGDGISVIDIEGGWNWSHEDQRQNQGGTVCGTATSDMGWENHGTAVVGEIGGDANTIGAMGIAPNARISGGSIFGSGNSVAKTIKCAADRLKKGDIILLELHRPGPKATGRGQEGFIAIEFWDADYAAIRYATAKGIIVVEAAGNGGQNLDDPAYQRRFDRTFRDSGAILVGAGAPPSGNHGPDRSRLGFSNYGRIIDAQGYGREVVTTGYGNLQGGSNKNKWYTNTFSGTSSASPIVVGAVACLQGIRKAAGQPPYTFAQLRNEFRTKGSPQQNAPGRPVSQRIGNRPNLKAIIGTTSSCTRYKTLASRYLAAYRQTNNRRYLCLYYQNMGSYYCCLYREKRNRRYLCLCYRYRASYYQCQYQITRNPKYNCSYLNNLASYYCCQYALTRNKNDQCNCHRYRALYFNCMYRVTKNRRYLCSYNQYLGAYYNCLYQRTRQRRYLCLSYRYYGAAYCCFYQVTKNRRYLTLCNRYTAAARNCK